MQTSFLILVLSLGFGNIANHGVGNAISAPAFWAKKNSATTNARVSRNTLRTKRAIKLVLDTSKPVYDINVAFSLATTVWFPVSCRSVTVGDPKTFLAIIDERFKNRIVITPRMEALGAKSNVTVDCEQDVRVVLALTLANPKFASHIVEFEFSKNDLALVRSAVEAEQQRCNDLLDENSRKTRQGVFRELLASMLDRFDLQEQAEFARKDFVIVKTFRQMVMGNRGMVFFHVQNRSKNNFSVKGITVSDVTTLLPVENQIFVMQSRVIEPETSVLGVVAFDWAQDKTYSLTVHDEDSSKTVRVDGIEF